MSTEMLRLLWSVVVDSSLERVAGLSDDVLVGHLLHQINSKVRLSSEEQITIQSYLRARKPLIREVLQGQAM